MLAERLLNTISRGHCNIITTRGHALLAAQALLTEVIVAISFPISFHAIDHLDTKSNVVINGHWLFTSVACPVTCSIFG
jgi:hypothetical protein